MQIIIQYAGLLTDPFRGDAGTNRKLYNVVGRYFHFPPPDPPFHRKVTYGGVI